MDGDSCAIPSAKFIRDVENYCKTHYKAQLFDNKITSSDLSQALRDAEIRASESVDSSSAQIGGTTAGSAIVDSFEKRSDDGCKVSDFDVKVGDDMLQSSLEGGTDDDSGFPKSDDLDDISEDDDFFDNLENPKKKPKLMLGTEKDL